MQRRLDFILRILISASLVAPTLFLTSQPALASAIAGASTRLASPAPTPVELSEIPNEKVLRGSVTESTLGNRAPASASPNRETLHAACNDPAHVQYSPPTKLNGRTVYYRYLRSNNSRAFECVGVGAGPVARKLTSSTEAGTCANCGEAAVAAATAGARVQSLQEVAVEAVRSGRQSRSQQVCPPNPTPLNIFAGAQCINNIAKGVAASLVDLVKGIGYLANKAFWGVVGFFKRGAVQQTDNAMSAVLRFLMKLPRADFLKAIRNTGTWLKELGAAFVNNLTETAQNVANCKKWSDPAIPMVGKCTERGPGWNCMNWDQRTQTVCALAGALGSDIALFFVGGVAVAKLAARSSRLVAVMEQTKAISSAAVRAATTAIEKSGKVTRTTVAVAGAGVRAAGATVTLSGRAVLKALSVVDKIPGLKQYNRLTEKAFLAGFKAGSPGAGRAARATNLAANDNDLPVGDNVASRETPVEAANDNHAYIEQAMAVGETPLSRNSLNAPTASAGNSGSGSGRNYQAGSSGSFSERRTQAPSASNGNGPSEVAASNESDWIGYSAEDAPPVSVVRTPRPNNRPIQTAREAKLEIRRRPGYNVRRINARRFVSENRARNVISSSENTLFREKMANPTPGGRTVVLRDFVKKANNSAFGLDRSTAITTTIVERAAKRYENLAKKYSDRVEMTRFEGPNRLEVRFDPKPGQTLPDNFESELADTFKVSVVEHSDFLLQNQLIRATDDPMEWFKYGSGPDSHSANMTARSNREYENQIATHRWEDAATQTQLQTTFARAQQIHRSVMDKYKGTPLIVPRTGRIDPTIADIIAKSDSPETIIENLREYNVLATDNRGRELTRDQQISRAKELDEYIENARNFGIEYYGERTPLNLRTDDTVCFGSDLCGQNGRNLSHNTSIFSGEFDDVIRSSVRAEQSSTDEFNGLIDATVAARTETLEQAGYRVESMRSGDDLSMTVRNQDGTPVQSVREETLERLASCTDGIVCLRDTYVPAQVQTTIRGQRAVRDKQTIIDMTHDLEKALKKTLPKRYKEHNFHVDVDENGVMTLQMSHPPTMTATETLDYQRDLQAAREQFANMVNATPNDKTLGLRARPAPPSNNR